jgi:hypothetical protein
MTGGWAIVRADSPDSRIGQPHHAAVAALISQELEHIGSGNSNRVLRHDRADTAPRRTGQSNALNTGSQSSRQARSQRAARWYAVKIVRVLSDRRIAGHVDRDLSCGESKDGLSGLGISGTKVSRLALLVRQLPSVAPSQVHCEELFGAGQARRRPRRRIR